MGGLSSCREVFGETMGHGKGRGDDGRRTIDEKGKGNDRPYFAAGGFVGQATDEGPRHTKAPGLIRRTIVLCRLASPMCFAQSKDFSFPTQGFSRSRLYLR